MEKAFQYGDSTISYNVYGQGTPVVLLHGFAEDNSIWNEQVQFLQQHCQLIVPDLPGSGKSQLLQGDVIQVEDFAKVFNVLLEHEEIDQCIMLGHSLGGYITLAFAELFPEKLIGFGLVHSTAFPDSAEKKQTRLKGIKFIEEHGAFTFIKSTTPNLFANSFKTKQSDKVSKLIEQGHYFSNEALTQYYWAMFHRPDRTNILATSEVPVLFVIGTEDIAAPLVDLLSQVHLPKVSYIHILEDTGHMSMLEKPSELNKHLLNFIVKEGF